MAKPATPPTTPPAIAPALFEPDKVDVYGVIEPGFRFHMAPTNTKWEMGIQPGWYRTFGTRGEELDELSAVCVAIQVQGTSLEKKAVMKLKIQASSWKIVVFHDDPPTFPLEVRAGEKYNPMIPTLCEFYSKTYVRSDGALLALAARKTRDRP